MPTTERAPASTGLLYEDYEVECELCAHVFQPPINSPVVDQGPYWTTNETRCPKCHEITSFDKVGEPPGP